MERDARPGKPFKRQGNGAQWVGGAVQQASGGPRRAQGQTLFEPAAAAATAKARPADWVGGFCAPDGVKVATMIAKGHMFAHSLSLLGTRRAGTAPQRHIVVA